MFKMLSLDSENDMLFIDGSYFIFFRYYAVLNWYRLQKKTTAVCDLLKEPEFVDKYKKMFEKNLVDLQKTHKTKWKNIVFFKDSPREEIWRNELYPDYKKDRDDKKDTFNKDIFKLTYNDVLYHMVDKYGMQVYGYPKMEADDLIAIAKNLVRQKKPSLPVVIVTNDNDYIQLYDENTSIVNLKGKELKERINVDYNVYLKYKIISGDKSDCIPSIMSKIGPKTAEKLCMSEENLERYFCKHPDARGRYETNKKLIDMQNIPEDLRTMVIQQISI